MSLIKYHHNDDNRSVKIIGGQGWLCLIALHGDINGLRAPLKIEQTV